MEINSCFTFINFVGASKISLIYYSHLVPVLFSLTLGFLVFLKNKENILAKIFFFFSVFLSLWLIFDLITWVSSDYFLIYAIWSLMDFVEIIFYLLGFSFSIISFRGKVFKLWSKILLSSLLFIPIYFILTKQTILGFDHSWCDAFANPLLSRYKLYIEGLLLLFIIFYIVWFILKSIKKKIEKKKYILMSISMVLFLGIFGISEYLSSTTGNYDISLYSLFIAPVFFIFIVYSIFSLDVFNLKLLSTYFLVFGFIILMGVQLIFVSNATNIILTIVSIVISLLLSVILFKNLKKETDQRLHIENLSVQLERSKMRLEESNFNRELANDKLKELDKAKNEFLSLASHQIRSPLTAINGYASMLLEGDYGDVSVKAKDIINRIYKSSQSLTKVVDDLLSVSKIEQGGMKYEMIAFDMIPLINEIIDNISINAKQKGLDLNLSYIPSDKYFVIADREKIRQVILNLIDNSIKYTNFGVINVDVKNMDDNVVISVKDTGIGMSEETKNNLFKKFIRGEGSKVNSSGSGIGLYLAKEIIEAHNGYIWAESEGEDKGATFVVEIKAIN